MNKYLSLIEHICRLGLFLYLKRLLFFFKLKLNHNLFLLHQRIL